MQRVRSHNNVSNYDSMLEKDEQNKLEIDAAEETRKQFEEDLQDSKQQQSTSGSSTSTSSHGKSLPDLVKGLSSDKRNELMLKLKEQLGGNITEEKLIQNAFSVKHTITEFMNKK
ncbi:unnamed protein product [Didymodactylos carnosus]|uniref:Uncharacterized protein n=1 Tax=Didymodactylos carnosus TaxID=1234261 RepID=A0A813Y3P9_9BILA|nr:unnamed protein product [Didymodactylos carnosus]CAF3664374.1 unnamed protein product [Didymodactylos carnosus]